MTRFGRGAVIRDRRRRYAASQLAVGGLSCEPAADAIGKGNIRFTASFGVAHIVPDGTNDLDSLALVADQRLYAAKSGGRNRVVAQ